MFFSTLFIFAFMSIAGYAHAQYVLEDDYMSGGNFFDLFSFWDTADPTGGFVDYVDQATATQYNLTSSSLSQVTFGADASNVAPNGRMSVRLTSNKSYQSGLIILDVAHMPGGICGSWPAFWTVGPDWPNQGEIDIIEGVNQQSANDMTLHTGAGCSITNNGAFSGSLVSTDCDASVNGNEGCQISTSNTATYGSDFNAADGGVYATEWTSSAISVFFFPRGSIPSDITDGSPDPSGWGTPLAQFQGGCDIGTTFTNQQIVFDTTFCGSWAGDVWSSGSCASVASTCEDYVENYPADFAGAYWAVNGLKVYQTGSSSSDVVSSVASSSSSSLAVSASVPSSTSILLPMSSVAASTSESTTSSPSSIIISTTPVIISQESTLASHLPMPLNATSSFSIGNGTNGTYPTASGYLTGTGTAPVITASAPLIPSSKASMFNPVTEVTSSSVASAPGSPPESSSSEIASTSSSVVEAASTTAAATTGGSATSWEWHHHRPTGTDGSEPWFTHAPAVKERHARHLRQHKRHGAERL